jgi:uncharacterized protein (UPF0264 family)
VAKLLVSVRSEAEAREALAGGASIIDVKEPSRGSLGMAPCSVWAEVRSAVPASATVSVALGELSDWIASPGRRIPPSRWSGIAFRKLGLADAGPSWRERWRDLRERIDGDASAEPDARPAWVAVAYLDWERAQAPAPETVIDEAAGIGDCVGVLFDTWDKSRRAEIAADAVRWIDRARASGRFVALAGSLDEAAIRRLRPLRPDLFAVRGAACRGGDRRTVIDRELVVRLVEAATW